MYVDTWNVVVQLFVKLIAMTVKDNRPVAHTENHTEAINKEIEAHIDHQDRTTSHDSNHNNNLTHNNKQLNNNIPSINIHPSNLTNSDP
jgi:hypothetical protein